MNAKQLNDSYEKEKNSFHKYINDIKNNVKEDIYTVINATLIKNPYVSEFPKKFFLGELNKKNKFFLFIKSTLKFYIKQFYSLFSYFIGFVLFNIFYKKNKMLNKNFIFIDTFFLIDNIIKDNKFNENYFNGLYRVFDKYNINYMFLPRLYGINKNPFKLIKFFKIINQDSRDFLFEFKLLSYK